MEENDNQKDFEHTKVSGAINQHTPPYWRLALPALGVRYIGRYVQQVVPKLEKSRFFDVAAGLWMLGINAFFANRTLNDLKTIFSESVAYELDKNSTDVTTGDIMKSTNKVIATATHNLVKYTGIRTLINATFFASFLPKPFKGVQSVDLGMGANSAYLVSEILGRQRTFFEQLQSFTDSKLNQAHALGDPITRNDIMQLYERNAVYNDPQKAFKGKTDSPMWQESQVIFARMADLMNDTYHGKQNGEAANFTLPKFVYMLGFDLLQPDKVEQTLAYIEVANRYGIPALKQVVAAVKDGTALADALQPYPVTLPRCQEEPGAAVAHGMPECHIRIDKPHSAEGTYADRMGARKPPVSQPPAAYADKIVQAPGSHLRSWS